MGFARRCGVPSNWNQFQRVRKKRGMGGCLEFMPEKLLEGAHCCLEIKNVTAASIRHTKAANPCLRQKGSPQPSD